mmetsp:Transcript_19459/g.55984  ORF Transcript_19459/g.55984 Transcript_19459/m.55984 type:complete len:184 (-) Transcript_19459:216-767(-)
MSPKPLSIRRRKHKQQGDDMSSSQIVEEATRENMLHRDLSDLLMGCCTGLDFGTDEESNNTLDVDRELEELEKEIALAKTTKPANQSRQQQDLGVGESGDDSADAPSARLIKIEPTDEHASKTLSILQDAVSTASSSSSSLVSSSASWTEQVSDSVDTNIKFLVGSCSSRAQVDALSETAFEV